MIPHKKLTISRETGGYVAGNYVTDTVEEIVIYGSVQPLKGKKRLQAIEGTEFTSAIRVITRNGVPIKPEGYTDYITIPGYGKMVISDSPKWDNNIIPFTRFVALGKSI